MGTSSSATLNASLLQCVRSGALADDLRHRRQQSAKATRCCPPFSPVWAATIATGSIAFIGFGEAARAFLNGWRTIPGFGGGVSAYGIKADLPILRCGLAQAGRICRGRRDPRLERAGRGRGRRGGFFGRHRRPGASGGGRVAAGPSQGRLLLRLRFLRSSWVAAFGQGASPTFSTGAGRRRILGLGGGKKQVGSMMGF